jgi:8-oxo-dGTP pyrophosphatase MutT (NUDIX family)
VADRIVLTASDLASLQSGDTVQGWTATALAETLKDAADLSDPNPVDPQHVISVMEKNFPLKALEWVREGSWVGPVHVPLDRIDFRDEDEWAASHQPEAVNRFMRQMKAERGQTHPVILVQSPERPLAFIVDGHHRTLAARRLGWPVKAYLGTYQHIPQAAYEAHSLQVHSGEDPANKAARPREDLSRAAFLLIRARNEDGKWRYLLQKRSDDSSQGGTWGLPGGTCHVGEDPWDAAVRETAEEIGELPPGLKPAASWTRGGGGETAFTYLVELPSLFSPAMDGATPAETAGWGWFRKRDVPGLRLHPAFRELWESTDWDDPAGSAVKSAETPYLASHHAPIGHEGIWHSKHPPMQYPAYYQQVRNALIRAGHSEAEAHAIALGALRRWASGGGHVHPEVRAAADAALAEYAQEQASHP